MSSDKTANVCLARGLVKLAGWSGALGVVWLFCLPLLATDPRVEAQIQMQERQGIDAAAMYYTELEAMKPILRRLERPSPIARN